jgi:hypothetical protein
VTPGPSGAAGGARKPPPKGAAKKAPSGTAARKPAPAKERAGAPAAKRVAQPAKAAKPAKPRPGPAAGGGSGKAPRQPGQPRPGPAVGGGPGKAPRQPGQPLPGMGRPGGPGKPWIPGPPTPPGGQGKDKGPGLFPGKELIPGKGFGVGGGKGGALNDWATLLGKEPAKPRPVRRSAAPWRGRMGVPAGGYSARLPDLRVPLPTPASASALLRVAARRVDPERALRRGVGALEASARELERLARRGGPSAAALARQGEFVRAVAGMAASMKPPRIPDPGPRILQKADPKLLAFAAAYGKARFAIARDRLRAEGVRSIARRFGRGPAAGAQGKAAGKGGALGKAARGGAAGGALGRIKGGGGAQPDPRRGRKGPGR